MTESEVVEALNAIGLRADPSRTDHHEWRRVFAIDPDGCTQARLSLRNGTLENAKWYCPTNGCIVPDEYWAWAWSLWTQHLVKLDQATWNVTVSRAISLAKAERAEKQAIRDANPKPDKVRADGTVVPRKRKALQLNVRKHLAALLNVGGAR